MPRSRSSLILGIVMTVGCFAEEAPQPSDVSSVPDLPATTPTDAVEDSTAAAELPAPAAPLDESSEVRGTLDTLEVVPNLPTGLSVVEVSVVVEEVPARLVLAWIDPGVGVAKVLGVTPDDPDGISASGAAVRRGVDIAIGSGFLSAFYPPTPLGLLIVNGRRISRLNAEGHSTLLAVTSGEIVMVPRETPSAGFSGAIQTGPRLLMDGRNGVFASEPRTRDPYRRAFVAICSRGTLFGVTLDPVHLFPLAELLRSSDFACDDAVNLSGGGSEALVVRDLDGLIRAWGNASSRQGSLLAVVLGS